MRLGNIKLKHLLNLLLNREVIGYSHYNALKKLADDNRWVRLITMLEEYHGFSTITSNNILRFFNGDDFIQECRVPDDYIIAIASPTKTRDYKSIW